MMPPLNRNGHVKIATLLTTEAGMIKQPKTPSGVLNHTEMPPATLEAGLIGSMNSMDRWAQVQASGIQASDFFAWHGVYRFIAEYAEKYAEVPSAELIKDKWGEDWSPVPGAWDYWLTEFLKHAASIKAERIIHEARAEIANHPDTAIPALAEKLKTITVGTTTVTTELYSITGPELAAASTDLSWLVPGLVPQGAMIQWDGQSEVGKTTMLMELMRALCTGGVWLDRQVVKTSVLLMSEQPTVSLKLQAAKLLTLDDFHVIPAYKLAGKTWEQSAAIGIREALQFKATLLIDNPLAFAGLKEGGENDSATIAALLKPLANAVAEHRFSIQLIRHQGWSGRSRGSTQFPAGVDVRYSLNYDSDPTSTRRVLTSGGRFGDILPARLVVERLPGGAWSSLGNVTSPVKAKGEAALLAAMPTSIDDALTRDELMARADDATVKIATAKNALAKLVDSGQAKVRGRGKAGDPYRYWRTS